jgi:hypothetical protein
MAISLLATDTLRWSPFWLAIGAVFLVERIVTAWRTGWGGRLIAAALVVELAYALYLQVCFLAALVKIATGRQSGWNYVPRATTGVSGIVPIALIALLLDWSPLPESVLYSAWFETLSLFVGINTLIFATRSLFQILPPVRRSYHRLQQRQLPRPAAQPT